MLIKNLHIICVAVLGLALAGCAVYPAVQVAGGAMTGYDAVMIADDFIPRDSVEGGGQCRDADVMLERRLRERLKLQNINTVSAHVFDRNAYLVGQFPERAQADAAVNVATSVQGLKVINCKFYPLTSPRQAQNDTLLLGKLTKRFGETRRLDDIDLRVEVIRSNAILIGEAGTYDQKTAAVAIASEVGGVEDVVDYIVVKPRPQTTPDGEKVAEK